MIALNWQYLLKSLRLFIIIVASAAFLAFISLPVDREPPEAERWKSIDITDFRNTEESFEKILSANIWVTDGRAITENEETGQKKETREALYGLVSTVEQGNESVAVVRTEEGRFQSVRAGDELLNGDQVVEIRGGSVVIKVIDDGGLKVLRLYRGISDES